MTINEFFDWLNKNQGVLSVIIFILLFSITPSHAKTKTALLCSLLVTRAVFCHTNVSQVR